MIPLLPSKYHWLLDDDARRFSDGITGHQHARQYRRWILVRLQDGQVSRDTFDTRDAALRSEHNEQYFMPYCIPYDHFSPLVAGPVLTYMRAVYDHGFRADRDSQAHPILPSRREGW